MMSPLTSRRGSTLDILTGAPGRVTFLGPQETISDARTAQASTASDELFPRKAISPKLSVPLLFTSLSVDFPSILKLDFPDGWPIFMGIMIALVIVLLAGVVVLLLSRFSGSAKPASHDHSDCCGCGHHHDHSDHADNCSAPKESVTAHDK
jgi:hypothetical protein